MEVSRRLFNDSRGPLRTLPISIISLSMHHLIRRLCRDLYSNMTPSTRMYPAPTYDYKYYNANPASMIMKT